MSPALKWPQLQRLGRPNRWVPQDYGLSVTLSLLLLLLLPPRTHQMSLWRFHVHGTWQAKGRTHTRVLGTGDCQPDGCQALVTVQIPISNIEGVPLGWSTPAVCFTYDQTRDYCQWWDETYGGCPYHSCNIHVAKLDTRSSLQQSHLLTTNGKGQLFINIKDPWDTRWVKGVQGKIYRWATDAYPVGSIRVFRSYVRVIPEIIQHLSEQATMVQETEQALERQLPHPDHKTDPFSWLALIRQGVQMLNHTGIGNISDCFLCASLGRPPLTAVPLDQPFTSTLLNSSQNLPFPPLRVPIFLDLEKKNLTICYGSRPNLTNDALPCNSSLPVTTPMGAPPGLFFWCNGSLTKEINSSSPFPCIPVTLVPQLTLYGEAEFLSLTTQLFSRQKRAIFLPMVAGISLASSLVAAGIGGGALTHSVSTSRNLEEKLQLAIEASAASITSLQRQITSVARVAFQNRRALDLLTADKGGTCLFLQEECCYYINEIGVVEDNVDALRRLKEELQRRQRQSTSPIPDWWRSWLTPILGPLILICILFMLVPCFLRFLRNHIQEVSRVAVNQMLLHPYTLLPTEPPAAALP
ncbi:endogenous retrovirus group FC1 Env polyprotein [Sagmatias obliquidens]|uniref:endogenous retrovirus group FC1 Env polyprotein n=1 Tax=Sagmatias obliquidens TaxID=3371155 RepID=UPI000F4411F3|nr:endogenous retrovirus group FC1 Env polyprotein [Lagenorhynchus obliquidens]XP_026987132.1 endogenous retrovirus group FC1 Env polyprotein [Lagenorhynchus obliquidens]XP_026987140.1 endogenous retrovirus group FC1 Env polyprotein [Lagenorhynchus obliquidens]XP_026987143.1 endogenous retrovirus group FC1 Env polyprotein [Lagenorhynchus obliquidens]XP_026987144.1 endogenous retrovirus group FC1 Env polyprotein [Lagenorhynchus obliquidens]